MTSKKQTASFKYQVRETIRPTVAPLTTAIGAALAAGALQAATITVTTLDGGLAEGECSLRSALYSATVNAAYQACPSGDAGTDFIEFDSALEGTINLQASQGFNLYYDGSTLPIGEDAHIFGGGRITISGSGDAPVFYAKYDPNGFDAGDTRFAGLTITGGGGDQGAGILARNRFILVVESVVTQNDAAIRGGGVYHTFEGSSGDSTLRIIDSEITGNQALDVNGGGGAIFSASRQPRVFISNDSDISGNVSLGSGGAIEVKPDDLNFSEAQISRENSSLDNNFAKYGNGGAINAESNDNGSVRMTLNGCELTGNEASANGGAIAIKDQLIINHDVTVLPGVVFDSNSAGGYGGAVWIDRTVSASTTTSAPIKFGPNKSTQGRVTFANNTSSSSGGAVYIAANDQVEVSFESVDFIGNEAVDGDGGAAYVRSGSSGFTLADVIFETNLALDGDGGGLQATSITGDVLGTDVRFLYNAAAGAGGARVFSTDGDIGFERSVFRDNTAVDFYGGGLQIEGNPAQIGIGQTVISGNSANFGGGGLDVFIGSQNAALQIKYSEFSDNTTVGPGGGALISGAEDRMLFLASSTVSGNSGSLGGALRVAGDMSLEVKYSTIANNYATTGTGGLLTLLPNGCDINNSLLAGNVTGPENDPEDLRGINDLCNVSHSLVSGNDSEFSDVTGNVLYQDPRMDPLADNGGSGGRTHALRADSPAVDAGDAAATAPSTDQRGGPFVRIVGSEVDMGAYERQEFLDAIFSDRFEVP